MSRIESLLVCSWCREPMVWSRFLDTWWCGDCRADEVCGLDEIEGDDCVEQPESGADAEEQPT
jgi:hypothetical protein